MKPDWKDAPEWAQFMAQDADGRWYFFEKEPRKLSAVWTSKTEDEGRLERWNPPCEWETSLEARP